MSFSSPARHAHGGTASRWPNAFLCCIIFISGIFISGDGGRAQETASTLPAGPSTSTPEAAAPTLPRVVTIGSDVYPRITAATDQSRFDPSSNLLVNTIGARTGLFGAAAREGLTWANRYVPGTDRNGIVQLYSLSSTGNYGAFFGARSSDNHNTRPENIIGSIDLVVADGNQPHLHWAHYSEGYVPHGSTAYRLLINDENSIQNENAAAPFVDPYDVNPMKLLNNLRLDCGIGIGNPQSCSNPLSILNNGAVYRTGIVFGDKSIETVDGAANAVALPADYALSWYGAPGKPTWRVYSTARQSHAGTLVMADEGIAIQVGGNDDATPALRVTKGAIAAPAVIAAGRPPAFTGTCRVRNQQGGNTAGAFALEQDCTAGTIVIGFSVSAPTGWSCFASNLARSEGIFRETSYDETSATLAASGARRDDRVVFSCTGF